MLPQVKKCCCSCNLQTGAVLIGAYQLIRGALEAVTDFMLETSVSLTKRREGWYYMWEGITIIVAIFGIIRMLAAVFLIFGASKERPRLVLGWLIFIMALTIADFAIFPLSLTSFFLYSSTAESVITLVLSLVDFGLELYFVLVVHSYYRLIRDRTPAPEPEPQSQAV